MAAKSEQRAPGASGEAGAALDPNPVHAPNAPRPGRFRAITIRVVRSAALWLLIGATITVGVAWSAATWAPPKIVGAGPLPAYPEGLGPPVGFDSAPVGAATRRFSWDAWAVRAQRVKQEDSASREVEVWAASRWRFGLPWRAMGFEVEMAPGLPDDWRGALATGAGIGRTGSDGVRRLPVAIAPLGFAGDAAVWGIAAWLLWNGAARALSGFRGARRPERA